MEDAKRLIQQYVDRCNHVRRHSAISYVTPNDMLAGRHALRDRKLEEARQQRQQRRRQASYADSDGLNSIGQCKMQLDVSISSLPDKM